MGRALTAVAHQGENEGAQGPVGEAHGGEPRRGRGGGEDLKFVHGEQCRRRGRRRNGGGGRKGASQSEIAKGMLCWFNFV